jgi:aminomethyltransferase
MGLERLVERQEADYIGKAALEKIRMKGVDRKLVGIEMPGDELPFEIPWQLPAFHGGRQVGEVTDLIWSPRLARNIGYVWVPIDLAGPGNALQVAAPDGSQWQGTTAAIPFLDARKKVPLGQAAG